MENGRRVVRPDEVADEKNQDEEEDRFQEKSGHCKKILVSFSVLPRLGLVDKSHISPDWPSASAHHAGVGETCSPA
jgi:hypothetical protein